MAKELDLSGVDDILAEDKKQPQKELDLSGVDDVLAQEPSMMDKVKDKLGDAGSFLKDNAATILNPLGEVGLDFAHGAAEGSTLGAADEFSGVVGTGMEKLLGLIPGTEAHKAKKIDADFRASGGTIPEESLADTYKSYQKGAEQYLNESSDRSPILNFMGNIGGSIATGVAAGKALGIGDTAQKGKKVYDIMKDEGKLKAGIELLKRGGKSYLKAAPVMAAEGLLGSEGNLVGTDADQGQVGKDVLSNLALGVPTMLGMQAVTDVAAPAAKAGVQKASQYLDDAAENNPFLRKAKKAFEFGEQGINPVREDHKAALLDKQPKQAQELLGQIKEADKKLGKEVGSTLEKATQAGQVINIDEPINKALNELKYSYENLQSMNNVSRGRQIFSNIANKQGQDISPMDAKDLLDDMDAFIGKFQASNNRSTAENNVLETLMTTRKELSESIKTQIPEYRAAAKRFEEFRNLVPETILSGERPTDVTNIYYGSLRNKEQKLYDKLNTLATESTGQGSGVENVIKSMNNTTKGMKQFEANELARGTVSPLKQTADQFTKQVRGFSDEAQLLRDMQTVKSPNFNSDLISMTAQLGKEGTLRTANIAGRVSKPLTDISKRVYKMPAEKLTQYADALEKVPGLKMYGTALRKGLENGDQAAKNAALFTIMQNPNARILFSDENEEEN